MSTPQSGTTGQDTLHASAASIAPQLRADMRKRWLFILPAVFITYSLACLDRFNYGLGAAAGLAKTLHISNAQSALLGSLFFLGYFTLQIPGASYARRKSATRLVFVALIAWGTFAALTGVIRTFWLLALDRLLLGMAESIVIPATLVLLTHWFTRAERSRANTLLLLGSPVTVLWMSAATGYLIHGVGWQWAFILEGLPAVLWAFIWILLVRDRPQDVTWLDHSTKDHLQHELDREQHALPQMASIRIAFRHPSVLLIGAQYFFWSAGLYGFVLWLPTMIRSNSSRSIQLTGLLGAVPYVLAIVLMLIAAHYSDKSLHRKHFIWPFLIVSGAALLVSFLTVQHAFWLAYCFLILAGGTMYAGYGPFFALVPDMLPKNVAGEVMALINGCGALGGFFGIWIVGLLAAYTGNSRSGILCLSLSLILSGVMIFFLRNPGSHSEAAISQH
jgi:sugar phosphate permease